MLEKFFARTYSFVLAVLFIALVIFFNIMMDTRSELAAMTFQLLLVTLVIVIFFNLLRVFLSRDRGSYRSMILEKPLFNPKGKPESLSLRYPLYPRFIAVYFDREGDDPYNDEIISIQAVRYENGYLTDGLFLPIKKSGERKRRKLLYFEDAYRFLRTYTRDFPVICDNKEYAATYLRENLNSMMLMDAVDAVGIAKMIYPGLDEYGTEDLSDYLKLEIEENDHLYGAKTVAAVYLDYLRLNGYYTDITWNPLAKKSTLEPVFPESFPENKSGLKDMTMSMNLWEDDEKLYKEKKAGVSSEDLDSEVSEDEEDDFYVYLPEMDESSDTEEDIKIFGSEDIKIYAPEETVPDDYSVIETEGIPDKTPPQSGRKRKPCVFSRIPGGKKK